MRRFAALVLLLGFGVTVSPSLAESAVPACPQTTLTRTGVQTSGINQANTDGTWNLAGASWSNGAGGDYPVRSESWTRGCIVGGSIVGPISRSATRDQWYDGGLAGTGDAFRQTLTSGSTNYLYQKDSFVSDFEDAYDPNGTASAQMVTLDHVRAEWVRDDCIENEGSVVASVTVTNTLFDGCFTAFAERPSGASTAQNGTGAATFTVEDSLVYVQPQPLGPRYCSSTGVTRGRCKTTGTPNVWLGSYGIWKWSTRAAATVTVRNTVFRLDMPSYSSCSSQRWPAGTYENVTLVWTNPQSYGSAGGCTNVLPAGVTLTTDVSVWDNAKAAWLAPTPEPAKKIIGMSAPDSLWSTRLAEVGACGIEARRIYATLNSAGDARMTVIQQAIADGMMPVVSYKVPNITTGGQGGYNTWAQNAATLLDNLGVPIAVTVWHEPNGDMTGPQFVALHQQLMPIFKRGLIEVGPIFNGFPLDTAAGRADLDTYTTPALFNTWDYFGIDTYNASSNERVPLMEAFVASHGHADIPLLIGEYNAQTATDIDEAGEAFLSSPTMWAFLLWNSGDGSGAAAATPLSGQRLVEFQQTKADPRALHDPPC